MEQQEETVEGMVGSQTLVKKLWCRTRPVFENSDKSSNLKILAGTIMLEFEGVHFETEKRIQA